MQIENPQSPTKEQFEKFAADLDRVRHEAIPVIESEFNVKITLRVDHIDQDIDLNVYEVPDAPTDLALVFNRLCEVCDAKGIYFSEFSRFITEIPDGVDAGKVIRQ